MLPYEPEKKLTSLKDWFIQSLYVLKLNGFWFSQPRPRPIPDEDY